MASRECEVGTAEPLQPAWSEYGPKLTAAQAKRSFLPEEHAVAFAADHGIDERRRIMCFGGELEAN